VAVVDGWEASEAGGPDTMAKLLLTAAVSHDVTRKR
jgi:hypothetical protein